MFWNLRILMRQGHRWVSLVIAFPFLLVLVTGILLQVKKEVPWVQPPTMKAPGKFPTISWDQILEAVKSQPQVGMNSWQDIHRVDVQPQKGIIKVTSKNQWEVQIDFQSGKVLQTAVRRSDWIQSLHDGSWFHENAKLYFFLPVAILVLGLLISGIYLFFLPVMVRLGRKNQPGTH